MNTQCFFIRLTTLSLLLALLPSPNLAMNQLPDTAFASGLSSFCPDKDQVHVYVALSIAPACYLASFLETTSASPRTLNAAHALVELLRLTNDALFASNEYICIHQPEYPIFLASSASTTLYALAGYLDGLRNNTFEGTPITAGTSRIKMAGRGLIKIVLPALESLIACTAGHNEEDLTIAGYINCSFFKNIVQHLGQAFDCSSEQKDKLLICCLALIFDGAEFWNSTQILTLLKNKQEHADLVATSAENKARTQHCEFNNTLHSINAALQKQSRVPLATIQSHLNDNHKNSVGNLPFDTTAYPYVAALLLNAQVATQKK